MSDKINYVELVQKILTDKEFRYNVKERDKGVAISFGINSKVLPGINYTLTVDEGGDSKLRSYIATGVDESKVDEMLELLNKINGRYRFTVFNLDDENDVCVTYDFAVYGDEEATANTVLDSIYVVSSIIDKTAQDIMQLNWKKNEESGFISNDDMFSE